MLENPADCGMQCSPYFRWAARQHASLWIMPAVRKLCEKAKAAGLQVVWVTFPICAMGGEFQKLTTLLTIGPRAHRMRALGDLTCTHAKHQRVAAGYDAEGVANAAQAAAYPALACASFANLLFTEAVANWPQWLQSPAAEKLQAHMDEQRRRNRDAAAAVLSEADPAPGRAFAPKGRSPHRHSDSVGCGEVVRHARCDAAPLARVGRRAGRHLREGASG